MTENDNSVRAYTTTIPTQLSQVAEQVARGERPEISVRILLSWFFGSKRRGRWIVSYIREVLDSLGLTTFPDFNIVSPDDSVVITPKPKPQLVGTGLTATVESGLTADAELVKPESISAIASSTDPTYRIRRLEIGNQAPVSVAPDTTIEHAVTLMLMDDYSQLPVMTSEREVKGIFSWKSVGSRWSQGDKSTRVREAMDEHAVIYDDASIFDVVDLLRKHDCVLVLDRKTEKISAIITSFDISVTFGELSEPFLVLNEIENHVRRLIEGNFTRDELMQACDPGDSQREVKEAADLSFGEYIRLLENPLKWSKLNLQIERVPFVKRLDEIRRIRNDVMHFDPEGTDPSDLDKLRDFVEFLRRLQKISPTVARQT